MLPKPDKSKKKFDPNNPESSETKEERIKREQKRLQKKRRLIIISAILTVGLSLSFWTYHSLKYYFNQPHQNNFHLSFRLPQLNFSSSQNKDNLSKQIQKIVDKDFPNLSVYITDNSNPAFVWSQGESIILGDQSLSDIRTRLNSLTPTEKSDLDINLPQGLKFQEIISDKNRSNYFSQITLPDERKLIILTSSSQSLDISAFVDSVYWAYAQSLTD